MEPQSITGEPGIHRAPALAVVAALEHAGGPRPGVDFRAVKKDVDHGRVGNARIHLNPGGAVVD